MGTALPQPSRSGFPWRKVGGAVTLLVVIGATSAIWWESRYTLHGKIAAYEQLAARLNDERAAARQEGLPLTPDELHATLPKVAPDDNAAPLYRSLPFIPGKPSIDSGPVEMWLIRQTKRHPADSPLSSPVTPAIRARFAALAPRFVIAEKASRLPGCDWNYHWDDIDLGDMALGRSLIRQFSARALMRADDGDLDGAFADVETSARISTHMGTDPHLIPLLVRSACEAISDQTFVKVALARPDDKHTLTLARSAEANFRPIDSGDFVRAFYGQMVSYRATVDMYRSDPVAFAHTFSTPNKDGKSSTLSLPTGPSKIVADAWEAQGIAYIRTLRSALTQSPSDDPLAQYNAVAKISAKAEAQSKRPGYELLPLLSSTCGRATTRLVYDAARDRLRRTLIALIAARQASGTHTWPTTLPAAPSAAPAERTDPFTGKPFHYATTDGGRSFLLYSVGENAQDDGGSTGSGGRTDDIAIYFP